MYHINTIIIIIIFNFQLIYSLDLYEVYLICKNSNTSVLIQEQIVMENKGIAKAYRGYKDLLLHVGAVLQIK